MDRLSQVEMRDRMKFAEKCFPAHWNRMSVLCMESGLTGECAAIYMSAYIQASCQDFLTSEKED